MEKRIIKFRGKQKDNGEWVYGYYIPNRIAIAAVDDTVYHYVEVIPETVGQYTGLHDKHGKEIYKGDIIKITLPDGETYIETIEDIRDIPWDFVTDLYYRGSGCSIEVIDTIHEHPELLKVKK